MTATIDKVAMDNINGWGSNPLSIPKMTIAVNSLLSSYPNLFHIHGTAGVITHEHWARENVEFEFVDMVDLKTDQQMDDFWGCWFKRISSVMIGQKVSYTYVAFFLKVIDTWIDKLLLFAQDIDSTDTKITLQPEFADNLKELTIIGHNEDYINLMSKVFQQSSLQTYVTRIWHDDFLTTILTSPFKC